jgi:prophage regulatory protein
MDTTNDAAAKPRKTHEAQPIEAAQIPEALLTVQTVAQLAGVHKTTIWLWAQQGKFPKPKRYGRKMTRWRAADVTGWLDRRYRGEA